MQSEKAALDSHQQPKIPFVTRATHLLQERARVLRSTSFVFTIAVIALALVSYLVAACAPAAPLPMNTSTAVPWSRTGTPAPGTTEPARARPATFVWDVPVGTVPRTEEEQLKDAIRAKRLQQMTSDDTIISVSRAALSGDWAVLSAEEKARTPQQLQPEEAFEILGQKTQTGWQIVAPNEPDFCQLLKEVPDTLTDKDYYIGCRSQ